MRAVGRERGQDLGAKRLQKRGHKGRNCSTLVGRDDLKLVLTVQGVRSPRTQDRVTVQGARSPRTQDRVTVQGARSPGRGTQDRAPPQSECQVPRFHVV